MISLVPWWMHIIAFLSGSIPCGMIVARFRGIDIRAHGSGNIGATNVGRVLGRNWGIFCLVLDALKGFLPVLAAGWFAGLFGHREMPVPAALSWLAVAVAAIMGHIFCPWLRFKGGKGVATSLGAFLAFWPALTLPMAASFSVWLFLVYTTRYVSIGSIVGSALFPVNAFIGFMLWEPEHDFRRALNVGWPFISVAGIMAVVVIWAHRGNVRRLRAGTETRVGDVKSGAKD